MGRKGAGRQITGVTEKTPTLGVRVVVADDSASFRRTLGAFLATLPGVRVVGEAADAEEAVTVVAETDPDVVLLDLVMPKGGGVSAAYRIKRESKARVILLSLLGQRELALATRAAGADGFVCKADIDSRLADVLELGKRD
jgi:DNA-binding NarL/FixJ family response regulator